MLLRNRNAGSDVIFSTKEIPKDQLKEEVPHRTAFNIYEICTALQPLHQIFYVKGFICLRSQKANKWTCIIDTRRVLRNKDNRKQVVTVQVVKKYP